MGQSSIAIVGAGPTGLMAADVLSSRGRSVTVYDQMPSFGRKFLLAGKSGLNITHAEDHAELAKRFGTAAPRLRPAIDAFRADDVRAFAASLGVETFVGSSGRVFPTVMKASPLLRAWLARLVSQGVTFKTRHRWIGLEEGNPVFETTEGRSIVACDALLLALGGGSWPRLGSDAAWVPLLREKGIAVADFEPANCGFDIDWSAVFRMRFAGMPVKSVTATSAAGTFSGEFVVTKTGIEGGLIYAHAASLRMLLHHGPAALMLDLNPGRTAARLETDLARQPAKASFSTRLKKGAGLDGVKAALLRELVADAPVADPARLAGLIKALPVPVLRPRPLAEAISSAGGIDWSELNDDYMLRGHPGVFAAGEMLDWEAPTGGYLITACLATGRAAGEGIHRFLSKSH